MHHFKFDTSFPCTANSQNTGVCLLMFDYLSGFFFVFPLHRFGMFLYPRSCIATRCQGHLSMPFRLFVYKCITLMSNYLYPVLSLQNWNLICYPSFPMNFRFLVSVILLVTPL